MSAPQADQYTAYRFGQASDKPQGTKPRDDASALFQEQTYTG